MNVLSSRLAGRWYAGDPGELRMQVRCLLDQAPTSDAPDPCALLVPHAGFDYSGPTAAAAYRAVEGMTPSRVVVLGPSHRMALRDAALLPRADGFRTPLGELAADAEGLARLRAHEGFGMADDADWTAEHSVEIQFPFLQAALPGAPVVPVLVGQLSPASAEGLARGLRTVLAPGALLVVSSDFTHFGPSFGYVPFRSDIETHLRRLDLGAFEKIREKDGPGFRAYLQETGATICGADAISLLLALLGPGHAVHRLAYTTSGHTTGDWSHAVSYLAAAVSGVWDRTEDVS